MGKKLFLISLLFHIPLLLWSQDNKNNFSLYISDNRNKQYEAFNYHITNDSLVITGLSDYGNTKVDYLSRALTQAENRNLKSFMDSFPPDQFNELYFKDYANLEYISPDHYPRIIDIIISNLGKSKTIRINNFFERRFSELFSEINTLLPEEVRIRYEEKDFSGSK